jgi:predicted Zn-dependent protease
VKRLLLVIFACAVTLVACAKVPVTGRSQLNLIPDDQMVATSAQQYQSFLTENPPSADAKNTDMVKRAGVNIQKAVEAYMAEKGASAQLAGYAWEFNLVESQEVNAWCMPGGKVVVYSGILPVTKDETGLAVVMGHEIAHAVAKHGAERMSQQLMAEYGSAGLAAALHKQPKETQGMWMAAFGAGAQYGVLLPFSRQQESEADHLGLIFMAMAGYDPNESVEFWGRMASMKGGEAPPEMTSTHPSDETRIKKLKELIPEAMKYYKK